MEMCAYVESTWIDIRGGIIHPKHFFVFVLLHGVMRVCFGISIKIMLLSVSSYKISIRMNKMMVIN